MATDVLEMTEAEEKLRLEAEARNADEDAADEREAQDQLAFPIGGTPASRATIEITGGAVEVAPQHAPRKDDEIVVRVRGWAKTVKHTSEQRGGRTTRGAVLVVDEIEFLDEE